MKQKKTNSEKKINFLCQENVYSIPKMTIQPGLGTSLCLKITDKKAEQDLRFLT